VEIKAFLKSGKEEHIVKIQKYGELYFSSLSTFVNSEDNTRKDHQETAGYLEHLNPNKASILTLFNTTDDSEVLKLQLNYAQLAHHYLRGYVFCLHCFDLDDIKIDEAINFNLKDDTTLLITNPVRFIELIKETLTKMGLPLYYSKVIYKDLKYYSGKKTVFEKDIRYKNESEFRIFIPVEVTNSFLFIKVGNIESISTLIRNTSNKTRFKISELKK
jgi:hypothetical protein